MTRHLSGGSAIIGMNTVICKKGETPKTPLQLVCEAATNAMREAGVSRSQIGALLTGRMPRSYCSLQYNQAVLNELKIAPSVSTEVTNHGAGALGAIQLASVLLASRTVDYVLVVTGEASPLWVEMTSGSANWEADLQFEAPFGPTTPSIYAQIACRYMYQYGVTSEQLARVAVENRRWALDHPHAAMKDKGPISVDDVMSSRMVATPMRMLDCAVWFPGGIGSAAVLTRSDLVPDAVTKPIYIRGFGQSSVHEWIGDRMGLSGVEPVLDGPDLVSSGVSVASRQAYEMAGASPKDVGIVETSAPFTFAHAMVLEQLGFCGTGEGGEFIESGGIDYDGGLPFNTTGGYLSFGQSGQGLYLLKEVADQIRGEAEGRQVPNIGLGLVHGHGGPFACHSVLLVSGEPA